MFITFALLHDFIFCNICKDFGINKLLVLLKNQL
jgi:hypothetical protein